MIARRWEVVALGLAIGSGCSSKSSRGGTDDSISEQVNTSECAEDLGPGRGVLQQQK
jgi:hypothetical protein